MSKKRIVKKSTYIIGIVILFFVVYFIFFAWAKWMSSNSSINTTSKESEQVEDSRSLIVQIKSKENIYLADKSDTSLSSIKIDEVYWQEIKYYFTEFSKIREPENYEPLYTGTSDDGLRFSTDLNYLRLYNVSEEEYYKIPISIKSEFENIIKKSIYTSFDFVKQYKTYENVTITSSTGDKKVIHKWKYDDLSYKMAAKRMVGKVQPEKNKDRSDYNFVIDIEGKNYQVRIETMGRDYVRIISKGEQSYYEVHTGLFDYLKDEIFKIEE